MPLPAPPSGQNYNQQSVEQQTAIHDLANTNYLIIAEWLQSQGYSLAASAGITGDIAGESGGNPESAGSGGRGLIGWTPASKLPNYAYTGNEYNDLMAQLQLVNQYNEQTYPSWPYSSPAPFGQVESLGNLKSTTNPYTAADMYSGYWEKPEFTYSDTRPQVTSDVWLALGGDPAVVSQGPTPVSGGGAASGGSAVLTSSTVPGGSGQSNYKTLGAFGSVLQAIDAFEHPNVTAVPWIINLLSLNTINPAISAVLGIVDMIVGIAVGAGLVYVGTRIWSNSSSPNITITGAIGTVQSQQRIRNARETNRVQNRRADIAQARAGTYDRNATTNARNSYTHAYNAETRRMGTEANSRIRAYDAETRRRREDRMGGNGPAREPYTPSKAIDIV